MTLFSVVSIVPAEKKTDEHRVPLSADGQNPPTHYGYHGWERDRPQTADEAALSKRIDVFTKEHIEKQPLTENEKTGRSNFDQQLQALGLRVIKPPDPKAEPDDPKAEAVKR